MDNNGSKYNTQVRLAALSVFLLGFVAGALALNAYHVWFGASSNLTKQQKYEQIFDQVLLNDGQKAEVQKIVGETREEIQNMRKESEPRMKEIRVRTSEKLQKVMTPEQWEQFRKLRDEMENSSPKNK